MGTAQLPKKQTPVLDNWTKWHTHCLHVVILGIQRYTKLNPVWSNTQQQSMVFQHAKKLLKLQLIHVGAAAVKRTVFIFLLHCQALHTDKHNFFFNLLTRRPFVCRSLEIGSRINCDRGTATVIVYILYFLFRGQVVALGFELLFMLYNVLYG